MLTLENIELVKSSASGFKAEVLSWEEFVKLKFLHKVGASTFDWPERDNIDTTHILHFLWSCPSPIQFDYSKSRNKQL